ARLGLDRWFPAQVLSCDVGACKPDAALFEAALGRLDVAPAEAVMVGDLWHSDVLGALRAGLRAIWIDQGLDPVAAMVVDGGLGAIAEQGPDGRARFPEAGRAMLERWLPGSIDEVEADLTAGRAPSFLAKVTRVRALAKLPPELGLFGRALGV